MSRSSWVDTQHDGGFAHEDHLPAYLHAQGLLVGPPAASKHQWDSNSLAFLDPSKRKQFQEALKSLRMPSWATHVDLHAQLLKNKLLALASQAALQ